MPQEHERAPVTTPAALAILALVELLRTSFSGSPIAHRSPDLLRTAVAILALLAVISMSFVALAIALR